MKNNPSVPTSLIKFFMEKPGYLKTGTHKLARTLGYTPEQVRAARSLVLRPKSLFIEEEAEVDNTNTSNITEFDEHLKTLGITQEDVKSVKYWQTMGGDTRFSIVTKNDGNELPDLDDVLEAIQKNVEPLPASDYVYYDSEDVTLVVFMSDKHIGAAIGENAPYEVEYNKEVLRERFKRVLAEIEEVDFNYSIEHIVVVDLGDALDGYNAQTTRGGHTLPQNMTNKEAFNTFVELHKEFYTSLVNLKIVEKISIVHLTESNHGGDFEYFATRALEEYINTLYKENPSIKFYTLPHFINPFSIAGNTYLLSHGKDSVDMRNGLPLTLDAKTNEYITNYVIDKGISFEGLHFIKGDLHQASTQWGKHFRYRNIPSMFGSSKWIMTNYGMTNPGCSFDLIEGFGPGCTIKQWEIWFNDKEKI